jgi:Tat protein translocase TatB subunit
MFDVGLGEILVIAIVGLLIFGPDRLPKAIAKGLRGWRDLRATFASARTQLVAGSGLTAEELRESGLGEIANLSPESLIDGRSSKASGPMNKSTSFDPDST